MRVSLIDADSICWAQAWLNKDKSNEELRIALNSQISDILSQTGADKYAGFLKNPDEVEFRRIMFPTYKGNRPPTPDWYKDRRETIWSHLTGYWKFAYTQNGYEVDDVLASAAYQLNIEQQVVVNGTAVSIVPIVCSIDKDMKQIPGWNYNPKTKEMIFIDGETAERNMLRQLLMGDSTDNIKGVPGIGPAKALKLIPDNTIMDNDLIDKIYSEYFNYHGNTAKALTDYAENILQVVMRRDSDYKFTLRDVPGKAIDKIFE